MAFQPQVRKAKRQALKASVMIEGLTGSGKSGLALIMAYILVGKDWGKVGMVDTENKSADLFVDTDSSIGTPYGEFQVSELTKEIGFKPSYYLACRDALLKNGCTAIIKDSISHAWQYSGGILSLVTEAKKKNAHYARDNYAAWGDDEVVKEKNELLELIRTPQAHCITTVRVKEKFEYVAGDDGKTKLQSLGEQQLQQADLKYEPDLVLHMIRPGEAEDNIVVHPQAEVIKSRYKILKKGQTYDFTPELITQLKEYLEDGADPKEILEQQRQDYIQAVKDYLDKNKSAVPIWKVIKKDAGLDKTKLEDIDLNNLKQMFMKLTID